MDRLDNWRDLPKHMPKGLIAIDGYSGSGKSTMAQALCAEYAKSKLAVTVIHTDWFATWDNPVGWWNQMVIEVLNPLIKGERVWFTPVRWVKRKPTIGPKQYLDRASVIIIEGVSSARRSMESRLDYSIWVDAGQPEDCLKRSIKRDGEAERQNLTKWNHFEQNWFKVDQTKQRCHVYKADDLI